MVYKIVFYYNIIDQVLISGTFPLSMNVSNYPWMVGSCVSRLVPVYIFVELLAVFSFILGAVVHLGRRD